MADSKNQDILEKALEGKVSTNEDLTVQEENLGKVSASKKTELLGSLLTDSGGFRTVGNISAGSLMAENASGSQPTHHPSRHQKLVQQKLFHGADVVGEGVGGQALTALNLGSFGITTDAGTRDAGDNSIFEDDDGEDLTTLQGQGKYLKIGSSIYKITAYNVGAVDRIQVDQNISESGSNTYEILSDFNVNGVDLSNATPLQGDELLVVSSYTLLGGNNSGVFTVSEINNDIITVEEELDTSQQPDPSLGEYSWQIIRPNPARLIPYGTSEVAGEETTYMFAVPEEWPVGGPPFHPVDLNKSPNYTPPVKEEVTVSLDFAESDRDATGQRLILTVDNAGSQEHQVGDFFWVPNVGMFRVNASAYPGADGANSEDLTLTPFYNTDVVDLDTSEMKAGSTINKVYKASEFMDIDTGLSGLQGRNPKNSAGLDQIRVKNLINPAEATFTDYGSTVLGNGAFSAVKTRNQYSNQLITSGSNISEVGYGIVLYPDDGTGSPDLSSPVYDLDSVRINPDQPKHKITVDYEEGLIQLPTPIVGNGDLDPNTYTDADGKKRIYATFFSYNGGVSPNEAAGLKSFAGSNFWNSSGTSQTTLKFYPRNSTGSGQRELDGPTWLFEMPEFNIDDTYHEFYSSPTDFGGAQQKVGFNGVYEGIEQRFTYRDKNTGKKYFATVGHGPGPWSDSILDQLYLVPKASTVEDTYPLDDRPVFSQEAPHIRLVDGQKRVLSGGAGPFTISAGDTFKALIDDVTVDVTWSLGAGTFDADAVATELESLIDAGTSLDSSLDDYNIEAVNIDGNPFLLIEADDFLKIEDGTINTALSLTDNIVHEGKCVELTWGHTGQAQESLDYEGEFSKLTWTGKDIVVNEEGGSELASLAGLGKVDRKKSPRYVVSGLGVSSWSDPTITLNSGEVKHQGSASRTGRTFSLVDTGLLTYDTSGLADGTYYLYFDPDAEDLTSIDVTDGSFEADFRSFSGVPLYEFSVTGGTLDAIYFDIRDFGSEDTLTRTLTVGATTGRFRTLQGAIQYVRELQNDAALPQKYVIELVEDVTIDKDAANYGFAAEIVLPPELEIRGNGHTVTVVNSPSEEVFFLGDIDNVTFKNIKFVAGTNANSAILIGVNASSQNSRNFTFKGVQLLEDSGTSNRFSLAAQLWSTRRVTIENCYFETINGLNFIQVSDLSIKNCEIGDTTSTDAIDISSSENISIEACRINVNTGTAIALLSSRFISVTDTYVSGQTRAGDPLISIDSSTQIRMESSGFDVTGTATNVFITTDSKVSTEDCVITGGDGRLVSVNEASEVVVKNSTLRSDTTVSSYALFLNNDEGATTDPLSLSIENSAVWCSGTTGGLFITAGSGTQRDIDLVFKDSRLAAPENSSLGQSGFLVGDSRLAFEGCEITAGFEFWGNSAVQGNNLDIINTNFRDGTNLGVDTTVAGFEPWIYAEAADINVSGSIYEYNGTNYTKGDHANTSSPETLTIPFEVAFYDSDVVINGFELTADAVDTVGTTFLLLEDCTSTVQGVSIRQGGAPDSRGIYVYRDQVHCVIEGTQLFGRLDNTGNTTQGIRIEGTATSPLTSGVVVHGFQSRTYEVTGTNESYAVSIISADTDYVVVTNGVIDSSDAVSVGSGNTASTILNGGGANSFIDDTSGSILFIN